MKRTVLALALIAVFAIAPALAMGRGQRPQDTERAKDPVCNIEVKKDPKLSVKYKGKTYYFCMKADMEAFKKNPEKYLKKPGVHLD